MSFLWPDGDVPKLRYFLHRNWSDTQECVIIFVIFTIKTYKLITNFKVKDSAFVDFFRFSGNLSKITLNCVWNLDLYLHQSNFYGIFITFLLWKIRRMNGMSKVQKNHQLPLYRIYDLGVIRLTLCIVTDSLVPVSSKFQKKLSIVFAKSQESPYMFLR